MVAGGRTRPAVIHSEATELGERGVEPVFRVAKRYMGSPLDTERQNEVNWVEFLYDQCRERLQKRMTGVECGRLEVALILKEEFIRKIIKKNRNNLNKRRHRNRFNRAVPSVRLPSTQLPNTVCAHERMRFL